MQGPALPATHRYLRSIWFHMPGRVPSSLLPDRSLPAGAEAGSNASAGLASQAAAGSCKLMHGNACLAVQR
jgi:hypothetical protein